MANKINDEKVESYLRDMRLLEGRRKVLLRELKQLRRGPKGLTISQLDGIGSRPSKMEDAMTILLRIEQISLEIREIDYKIRELFDILGYVNTGRNDDFCSSILILYYVDSVKIDDIAKKLDLHKDTVCYLKKEAVMKMNMMLGVAT